MIAERITSPELLDQYARVLGERWKEYADYGLGPALLSGGIIVGARLKPTECIGIVWAVRTNDPTTLYIVYIKVSEGHRRQGVAQLLEEELCNQAIQDGFHWAFSLAETWNVESDTFIRHQGWTFLGTVSNCYWRDDPTHFYFKDLASLNQKPPVQSQFWSNIYSLIRLTNDSK